MIELFQEQADLISDWVLAHPEAPAELRFLAFKLQEESLITIKIEE